MALRSIPTMTLAEFQAHSKGGALLQDHPCVVTGFMQEWPAYPSWGDLEVLGAIYGQVEVRASAPQIATGKGQELCEVQTTFGDYLQYMAAPDRAPELFEGKWTVGDEEAYRRIGRPLYCGTLASAANPHEAVTEAFSPLLPSSIVDCAPDIPLYFDGHTHFWLYVSNAGALTPLHIDNNSCASYLAQVAGRKRAILFGPADHERVYSEEAGFVDPETPDLRSFPRFGEATQWTAELEPGAMLLWGPEWAHWVETTEQSVSLSYDYIMPQAIDDFVLAGGWLRNLGVSYLLELRRDLSNDHGQHQGGVSEMLQEWHPIKPELLESIREQVRGAVGKAGTRDLQTLSYAAGVAAAEALFKGLLAFDDVPKNRRETWQALLTAVMKFQSQA